MAINQLQIPTSGNINNLVDQSQWTSLANLGNVYQKAQQDAANKAAFAQYQQTGDPKALIGSGDMNLAKLGVEAQNHRDLLAQQVIENKRADINTGINQTNAGINQKRFDQQTYDWEHPVPDNYEENPDKTPGAPKLIPIAGGPADPKTIEADARAKAAVKAEDVPQATLDFLADRVRAGDPTVKVGYARNPGVIAKIDTTAQQREEAGIPISAEAKNIVENKISLGARNAAEHRLGTINTNTEFYGNNALGALDIADKASAEVPRTNYPKINEALNAWRTNTGDPKVAALGATVNTLINDYAKFTGGGTPTDALRGEAYKMISAAKSHEQFLAITNAMRQEINRGKQSPGMVRGSLKETYAPGGTGGTQPAAPGTAPGGVTHFSDYFK